MFFYAVRRILGSIVLLFVMVVVTFLLFNAAPTNPARLACGKNCSPVQLENITKYLGYDKPLTTQFTDFMSGFVTDRKFPEDKDLQKAAPDLITNCKAPCLGYTGQQNSTVWAYLKPRLPITISIGLYAFVLWIVIGVGLGIVAALNRGKWIDRILTGSALTFYSFPTFFSGLLLFELLFYQYQLVPQPQYVSILDDPVGFFKGLFLPCFTLALFFAAAYVRQTRSYVLDVMGEDYLRTARAKGLKERRVLFKHTLRAALTPIVTIAGLDLAGLLGGAAITETVFNIQGLGRAAVTAAVTDDLAVNTAIVLLAAAFIVFANVVVDILYAVIDPRVRY